MERFAGNNADTKRYRIVLREAMERLRHLRVVIDDGSVRCFIEKASISISSDRRALWPAFNFSLICSIVVGGADIGWTQDNGRRARDSGSNQGGGCCKLKPFLSHEDTKRPKVTTQSVFFVRLCVFVFSSSGQIFLQFAPGSKAHPTALSRAGRRPKMSSSCVFVPSCLRGQGRSFGSLLLGAGLSEKRFKQPGRRPQMSSSCVFVFFASSWSEQIFWQCAPGNTPIRGALSRA
jgi:hypothetical protein